MKLIGWQKKGYDWLLTFEKQPGLLGRLFSKKPERIQYIGSSTVFHYFPSFKRVGLTGGERWLSGVVEKLEYQIKFENRPSVAVPPAE
jgi:hypothetical protein